MNRLIAVPLGLLLLLGAPELSPAAETSTCPAPGNHSLTLVYPALQHAPQNQAPPPGTYVLDESLVGKELAQREGDPSTEGAVSAGIEGEMPAVRFKTESVVTPYVGAGLIDSKPEEGPGTSRPVTADEEKPKPYVGAGIGCDLGGGSHFSLGYRFSSDPNADATQSQLPERTDQPLESHDFSFRLKLDF